MQRARRHRVPLSGRTLEILKSFRVEVRGGWVFPGIGKREGKPIGEAALAKMLHLMGDWRDNNGERITVHGFRSTFRDWAAERTSFAREVAEVAIAHSVGDETYEAYQRGDLLEKRRRLMEAGAKYCKAPAQRAGKAPECDAGNVVVLRG